MARARVQTPREGWWVAPSMTVSSPENLGFLMYLPIRMLSSPSTLCSLTPHERGGMEGKTVEGIKRGKGKFWEAEENGGEEGR